MKISLFVSFKKWIISVFNPPYQLTLSEKIIRPSPNEVLYVFKQYGSHDYIKISYTDILNNHNIMRSINPTNLMDIHLNEYLIKLESDRYRIKEQLRNNIYALSNNHHEEIYSGEHICKNIDMFSNISTTDICKIAYASGFNKGRKISTEISEIIAKNHNERLANKTTSNNIIKIKCNK